MANFANVFTHLGMLQAAVQRIDDDALKREVQAYISELSVMLDEIQTDQTNTAEADSVDRKVEKAISLLSWLDRILELLM